jgi:hypothetical protein
MAQNFVWDTDCRGRAYGRDDGYRIGDVWPVGADGLSQEEAELKAALGLGHFEGESPVPIGYVNPKYAGTLKQHSDRIRASAAAAAR